MYYVKKVLVLKCLELKQEIYERAQNSKNVTAEFTKRGKISNLSDLV